MGSEVARDRSRYKLTQKQRELLEAVARKELPARGDIARLLQPLRDKLLVEQSSLELTADGRRALEDPMPWIGAATIARIDRELKLGGYSFSVIALACGVTLHFVSERARVLGIVSPHRRGRR